MSGLRSHPEYAEGFEDGWRGGPRRLSSAPYCEGYEAASRTLSALTAQASAPDISFHVRLTAASPAAA